MASSRLLPDEESCFQCCWASIFRTGTRKTLNEITERPLVECTTKGDNKTCDECLKYHNACEKVAELLEADYFDLFDLLRWSDQVALQPTTVLVGNSYVWVPLWTDDEKRSIIQMELELMKKFREVENTHRVEHRIDVGKRRRARQVRPTHTTLLYRRGVPPCETCSCVRSQDVQAWNNKQRLRLEYGDKNFLTWANAKLAFAEEILSKVERKDGRLVASYKQRLPSTTIVYS